MNSWGMCPGSERMRLVPSRAAPSRPRRVAPHSPARSRSPATGPPARPGRAVSRWASPLAGRSPRLTGSGARLLAQRLYEWSALTGGRPLILVWRHHYSVEVLEGTPPGSGAAERLVTRLHEEPSVADLPRLYNDFDHTARTGLARESKHPSVLGGSGPSSKIQ